MQSTRILQITIVILVGGLIAFLFFNGKSNSVALVEDNPETDAVMAQFPEKGFNFALLTEDVKKELSAADKSEIEGLEKELEGTAQREQALLKLAEKYSELNQPAMSGYYFKQLAEAKPQSEEYWFNTGKKFFEAQQTVSDSMSFAYFVNVSMEAFNKTLEINPQNFEAKADQAINLIEGTGEPMKGIGLLREIIQVEPDNRKALFYLGILSIQSGQHDKAAERFEKLVSLGPEEGDPSYPYYYRYLGQVYAQLNQKEKALEAFKKYKLLAGAMADPRPAQEADQLIKSLEQAN